MARWRSDSAAEGPAAITNCWTTTARFSSTRWSGCGPRGAAGAPSWGASIAATADNR